MCIFQQYTGVWYLYEAFDSRAERNQRCTSESCSSFGFEPDTLRLRIHSIDKVSGQWQNNTGVARTVDAEKPAELHLSMEPFGYFRLSDTPNYVVMATDYVTHSLVFSCWKLPFVPIYFRSARILTRQRGVTPPNIEELHRLLEVQDIRSDSLQPADQTNCGSGPFEFDSIDT